MASTLLLNELGNPEIEQPLRNAIDEFLKQLPGDWQVSIIGSHETSAWEMRVSAADGDNARAAQLFGHAVEVLPDAPRSADAYNDLGWSLAKLGRYDEAIAAYETAIRKNPGMEVYRNNLALARREREARPR